MKYMEGEISQFTFNKTKYKAKKVKALKNYSKTGQRNVARQYTFFYSNIICITLFKHTAQCFTAVKKEKKHKNRCHKRQPVKYRPVSWNKLKNYLPKIKQLLFLNPFEYRHNPSLYWKAFQKSELLKLLLKHSYRSSNTMKANLFLSIKIYSVFDWIQIILAVAGAQHSGVKSQHWTTRLSNLKTLSPKISILHCFF